MFISLCLTILGLVLFYFLQQWLKQVWFNLPPGPWSLPIVGYLPFLGKQPANTFNDLAKTYGHIYSIKLGSKRGIILNNHKLIREAFGKNEFLGRPKESILNFLPDFKTFLLMSGPDWAEQRRFTLQTLRNLGMNRSTFCLKIKEELDYLVNKLRDSKGELIDFTTLLTPSMSNNIFSLVFGRRMNYDDAERKKLDAALLKGNKLLDQTGTMNFIPILAKILGYFNLLNLKEFMSTFGYMQNYIRKDVEAHRAKHDPDHPKDYIDHYLIEMNKRDSTNTNSTFTMNMLAGNTQLLFGAGSNTVRTSVMWAMLTLAIFQEVQDKIREEIKSVVGPNRDVDWEDHSKCVYTEAVLMELQRWKTIAPLGIVHSSMEKSTVGGYEVPKDCFVVANLRGSHHDPEYWGDPENFRPERFLDETRTKHIKHDAYIPFSFGRKACPGESLALMENFIYVTTIVQKFKIELGKGIIPSFNGFTGLVHEPNITSFRFFAIDP